MNPRVESPIESNRGTHRERLIAVVTNSTIRAKDIMTTTVITVQPGTTVRQIALLLGEKHISAVPVVDHGSLVGIVSEGDLIQELGTETESAPWPGTSGKPEAVNAKYAKWHGKRASDVMTRNVITVFENTSLPEIARTLEAKHIKRVPVMRGAKLTGLVSRSDIVRALAARPEGSPGPVSSDDDMTVTVSNGIVELDGSVEEEATREPSRVAVEHISYVVEVKDHRNILQPY